MPPLLQIYENTKVLKRPSDCIHPCVPWIEIKLDGGPAYVELIEIKNPTITQSQNPNNTIVEVRVGNVKTTEDNKKSNRICSNRTHIAENGQQFPTISIPCETPMQGSLVTIALYDGNGEYNGTMTMKELKIYGKGMIIIRI